MVEAIAKNSSPMNELLVAETVHYHDSMKSVLAVLASLRPLLVPPNPSGSPPRMGGSCAVLKSRIAPARW